MKAFELLQCVSNSQKVALINRDGNGQVLFQGNASSVAQQYMRAEVAFVRATDSTLVIFIHTGK